MMYGSAEGGRARDRLLIFQFLNRFQSRMKKGYSATSTSMVEEFEVMSAISFLEKARKMDLNRRRSLVGSFLVQLKA